MLIYQARANLLQLLKSNEGIPIDPETFVYDVEEARALKQAEAAASKELQEEKKLRQELKRRQTAHGQMRQPALVRGGHREGGGGERGGALRGAALCQLRREART